MYYSTRERDTQLFLINQEITDKVSAASSPRSLFIEGLQNVSDEQKASMLNGFNALVQYCEEAKYVLRREQAM